MLWYFSHNPELLFLSYSLTKQFGLATEEFCRSGKELYSAGEKLYLPEKESGRVPKEFE
ncbi:hypothetical protein [Candidatus Electronema sp. PJ]|uniref:hypothetical protein n=1 Tax=Candidatus Electronema sp. PJ TaxID=3401572 RepID=UPI003AA7CB3F